MAQDKGTETQKLTVTGTASAATFEGGIQKVYLTADADCFVDFDEVADTGSFLIKANEHPAEISLGGNNVKKVWAITAGGSANLYILGVRGGC